MHVFTLFLKSTGDPAWTRQTRSFLDHEFKRWWQEDRQPAQEKKDTASCVPLKSREEMSQEWRTVNCASGCSETEQRARRHWWFQQTWEGVPGLWQSSKYSYPSCAFKNFQEHRTSDPFLSSHVLDGPGKGGSERMLADSSGVCSVQASLYKWDPLNPAGSFQELLGEAGVPKREGDEKRKESLCLFARFTSSDCRGSGPGLLTGQS